ncbi:hypothetical protein [Alteromonas lipotrueiana]|nr:hypothetical protein [Alteromonas lipotrueiana]
MNRFEARDAKNQQIDVTAACASFAPLKLLNHDLLINIQPNNYVVKK